MPKHPLINYPPLHPSLHETPKNRICVLVLSNTQSFILIPLVLSSPATVTEHRVHTTFKKKHFFRLLGPQNVKIHQNLNIDFFHDDNTFPIRKEKRNKWSGRDVTVGLKKSNAKTMRLQLLRRLIKIIYQIFQKFIQFSANFTKQY